MGQELSTPAPTPYFQGPMEHIMSMLSFEERLTVRSTFTDYKMLLSKAIYAIGNIQADVELYELPTFDKDRATMLRNTSRDTVGVQRLTQVYEEATALQPRIRQIRTLVEQKGKEQRKPVNEIAKDLKEMSDSLINICQVLTDHKGSGHAMNRVLRYDPAFGREIYCYIDPEFITKLGQTSDYLKECLEKAKKF